MNEKQFLKWEKTRKSGKSKYLIKWVFYWGISSVIIFSILINILIPQEQKHIILIISLLLFPISGFFVGYLNWIHLEKKYQNNQSKSFE